MSFVEIAKDALNTALWGAYFLLVVVLAVRIILILSWQLFSLFIGVIDKKITQAKTMRVISKAVVPPGTIWWSRRSGPFVLRAVNSAEMWLVAGEVPMNGFLPGSLETHFMVGRDLYLSLAPGDEIENPHFGGIRNEIVVEPWLMKKLKGERA